MTVSETWQSDCHFFGRQHSDGWPTTQVFSDAMFLPPSGRRQLCESPSILSVWWRKDDRLVNFLYENSRTRVNVYIKKKMFFRNPIHKPARVYRRWFATLWATCLWNRWLSATNRTWSRNTWFLRYGWPAISPSTGLLRFSPTAAKCATCIRDSTIFNWTMIHPLRYVVCTQHGRFGCHAIN